MDRFFLDVLGLPHALKFPDSPDASPQTAPFFSPPFIRLLSIASVPFDGVTALPDADYGAIAYGEFLATTGSARQTEAGYTVNVLLPDGRSFQTTSLCIASEPERGANADEDAKCSPDRTIAPLLWPVQAPRIGGNDAFAPQAGVGLTPTLSWEAPTLGHATSYRIIITNAADFSTAFMAIVESGTSFVIPAGFLTAGQTYFATITSQSAPGDRLDSPIFRGGAPGYFFDCNTAGFTP